MSNDKKHTPGPWSIHRAYVGAEPTVIPDEPAPWVALDIPISQGDKVVAHANMWTAPNGGFPRVNSIGEVQANACLIAAAPDLLTALIEMVQTNQDDLTIEHYNRARAAIAKAEGRESDPYESTREYQKSEQAAMELADRKRARASWTE